ncbi:hypothetical protein UFOVP1528_26 [uncultured Caudovirales phage]|uniref:Uncharacterized protein n=1 Tax=uncultured Caudovirales phage TaxID=2100421 RepID=A0A6J5SF27_9CAUD|nr:hypothetical protein UFOVP905_1 [uncultured Caudovirales phage]CAB4183096.1 hypothetical protein UFOVP1080_37 [uncultured Caudovirales phage]CAB4197502.1 hypothetical protein UFOVP1321_25 [uncultured Caudovirales phage]CAB4212776.1 hypothetical protein UFOVP1432_38 [uncultured Caudovirales phage]CAB5227317.1 hypothetical protein UFOVP1528_26 [uncultured Caudovirales phage]
MFTVYVVDFDGRLIAAEQCANYCEAELCEECALEQSSVWHAYIVKGVSGQAGVLC